MTSRPLHVVVGAGSVGLAVVDELRAREGEEAVDVRVVNRSGVAEVNPDVEVVGADVTDHDQARRACADARVVYNCTNAPYTDWAERFPPIWEGVLAGAMAADAVLVCADNLYCYGAVDGPLTEDLPWDADTRKGRVRAEMGRRVLDAHEAGEVRATLGKASDFYGPRVRESTVGERVFGNLLDGKSAEVVGDPDQPHTYTYVRDFARALVLLGGDERAWGDVWHVPSATTLTTREFVELVAEEAGRAPRMRVAPGWLVRLAGVVSPTMRELAEMRYEFEAPFVVSHEKFDATFDLDPTPHREAIAATVDWYRRVSVSPGR
ncbi:NAD-dependent epimerase/dehydratase family protein [Salinigranum sp.]|uniref:NAD-dependent epimerase/dehydratase family protein n=1 Tax=Salinigranum sp. TaxID=1966351 RepID=UPI00356176B0